MTYDFAIVDAGFAGSVDDIRTSEDVVVSQVGRDLYEKFFGVIPA